MKNCGSEAETYNILYGINIRNWLLIGLFGGLLMALIDQFVIAG